MSTSREALGSIVVQPRDLSILRGLFESRIMTRAHIAAIYFAGAHEYSKKRLQQLRAAGLIGERPGRRANERAVFVLTDKGLKVLCDDGLAADFQHLPPSAFTRPRTVSELTLRHELAVLDVKAALYSAVSALEAFEIIEFSTWPRLHEFRTLVLVKPDGFVRIRETANDGKQTEHAFFVEVDRSTESLDTLVVRIRAYVGFYKTGGFAARLGAPRTAFRQYPFRLLIVLKSEERRNNVAKELLRLDPPILTQVYLSTLSAAATNPFGAVWIRPIDFRHTMVGPAPTHEHQRTQKSPLRSPAHIQRPDRVSMVRLLPASQAPANESHNALEASVN